jgi:hypothetical protein
MRNQNAAITWQANPCQPDQEAEQLSAQGAGTEPRETFNWRVCGDNRARHEACRRLEPLCLVLWIASTLPQIRSIETSL